MFSDFMVNAWIAGALVAATAGVVGFFVVLRGSSFAAHALPLGAFPGAAAAHLLGVDEFAGVILFSGLSALGLARLGREGRSDVAAALVLSASLALGALLLSMTSEYSQGVYALLFGDVLGVSRSELAAMAVVCSLAVVTVGTLFRPLVLTSLSSDLADVRGASSRWMEYSFLTLLAFATATTLPVVGALLTYSLMIGPASAARFLTDRPVVAMALSAAIALAIVWAAIALSYVSDWPIGFFVGALTTCSYALGRLHGWRRRTRRMISEGEQ